MIEGIKVGNEEIRLGQFADDTTLFSMFKQQSI